MMCLAEYTLFQAVRILIEVLVPFSRLLWRLVGLLGLSHKYILYYKFITSTRVGLCLASKSSEPCLGLRTCFRLETYRYCTFNVMRRPTL